MTEGERLHLNAQRRAYLFSHPLAFTIGVWAAISGFASVALIFAGGPLVNDSSLAILLPSWAEVLWGLIYLFGGVLLTVGIVGLSLRSEIAGCLLVAGAQIVNVYAVTVVRGPAAGFISGVGFAIAVGLVGRVGMLLRHR